MGAGGLRIRQRLCRQHNNNNNNNNNNKLCGRSRQANYTDRVTVACRRSQCQPLRVEGVTQSAQRIPTAVNLGFLDRSRYKFLLQHFMGRDQLGKYILIGE
jgi:hypothetical protein